MSEISLWEPFCIISNASLARELVCSEISADEEDHADDMADLLAKVDRNNSGSKL